MICLFSSNNQIIRSGIIVLMAVSTLQPVCMTTGLQCTLAPVKRKVITLVLANHQLLRRMVMDDSLLPKNLLDNSDILPDYGPMKPLPVPIPFDLAEALEVHPSNISHVNAGRRKLPFNKCIWLMDIAQSDNRLTGLCFIHLRPELKPALPYLCPKKKSRKRAGR